MNYETFEGLPVFTPATHYLTDARTWGKIRQYLWEQFGVQATDEMIHAVILAQDYEYVQGGDENVGFENPEVYLETAQDRYNSVVGEAAEGLYPNPVPAYMPYI